MDAALARKRRFSLYPSLAIAGANARQSLTFCIEPTPGRATLFIEKASVVT
jgi:hypothetical protein